MTGGRPRSTVISAMHALPHSLRTRLSPEAFDRVLAVVLLVLGELQAWLGNPVPHDRDASRSPPCRCMRPWRCRRRHPATAGFAAQALVAIGFGIWGGIEVIPYSIAWGCAIYGLTVWTQQRTFAYGVAFVAVGNLIASAAGGVFTKGVPFAVVTAAAMVLVRRVVGDRERRAQLAERERDVAAREAVLVERARIARELHDVIAHHVSVMVLQAGAERRTLDNSNAPTREVLETIEHTGRGALVEMRRLLGMLRDEEQGLLAPQPGLSDVPMLVGQLREAGLPVELHVDGEQRELPVGIELSAYRIVQEALTNSLKHAGGRPPRCASDTAPTCWSWNVTDAGVAEPNGTAQRARRGRDARTGRSLRRLAATPAATPAAASPSTPHCRPDDHRPRRRRSGARPGRTAKVLESEPEISVIGEAADGAQAVDAAARLRPDVTLMDIRMPGLDGIEATRRITAAWPSARVLILTTFALDEYVYESLRAGASGFMLNDAPPEEIAAAVRVVAGGDALLAPAVTRAVIEEFARRQPSEPRAEPAAPGRADAARAGRFALLVRAARTRRSAGSW